MEHQTLGRRVICPREPAYYIVDCRIFRFESRRKRFCEKSSARLQSPKTNFCKITFVAWFQLVLGFFYWIETAKANTESQLSHNGKKPKTQSVSWITVSPCLMRLLVLGKIRISQMFGLCDLPNANFSALVQVFGYFCPKYCSNEINRPKIAVMK